MSLTDARDRRQPAAPRLAHLLAPLLVGGVLAGCGTHTIQFDRDVTAHVGNLDASQLQRFGMYYQDNYWEGPSPSAVLLDVEDDVAFEGAVGWRRAQDESAARLLSRALDAGFMATELREPDGDLLGYLVATERWYGERRNHYRLIVADDGGSYDVPHSQLLRGADGGSRAS